MSNLVKVRTGKILKTAKGFWCDPFEKKAVDKIPGTIYEHGFWFDSDSNRVAGIAVMGTRSHRLGDIIEVAIEELGILKFPDETFLSFPDEISITEAFPKLDRDFDIASEVMPDAPLRVYVGPAYPTEFPGWKIWYSITAPGCSIKNSCDANVKSAGWIWNGGTEVGNLAISTNLELIQKISKDIQQAISGKFVRVGPCVIEAFRVEPTN